MRSSRTKRQRLTLTPLISITHALVAVSSSMTSAWNLTDLKSVPRTGLKVMSTFACGGGSALGYKLAGYEVIAANDIDPEMQWHYERNIHPHHYFLCPIGDLLQ